MTHTPLWTPAPGTAGLIFDCDGTLADTMPIHYRAWSAMLAPFGVQFTVRRFYEMGGMPTSRIIPILAEESGVGGLDVPTMVQQKEELFLTFLDAIRPVDPVVQIAAAFRAQKRGPMAVASGGYRAIVRQTLETIGLLDWFDAIVCAEDTPRHKPDPDVFLEAARRLGLSPAECVVFEDTDIGLEAARRAGIPGIDVRPWLPPREGL
ncbi:MAG: HAD family hydrolase [Gemmataceae bacterium]